MGLREYPRPATSDNGNLRSSTNDSITAPTETVSQEVNEWIDGFLFVANKPILDLPNTKPVMANGPTELLSDFRALARWLIASDIVTSPKAKAVVRGWRQSSEAAAFPEELIAFRERLRETVVRMESGLLPTGAFRTK